MAIYSLCEGNSAGPWWHIRELTAAGKRLTGGVDTHSMCGHVKPPWGWDLNSPVERHINGNHVCAQCKAELMRLARS